MDNPHISNKGQIKTDFSLDKVLRNVFFIECNLGHKVTVTSITAPQQNITLLLSIERQMRLFIYNKLIFAKHPIS